MSADLYRRKPDVIGFSCYIWNIEYPVLAADIRKAAAPCPLWLVDRKSPMMRERFCRTCPLLPGHEGEGRRRLQLVRLCDNGMEDPADCEKSAVRACRLAGLTYRGPDGAITDTGIRPVMDLSRIPFSYDCIKLEELNTGSSTMRAAGDALFLRLLSFFHR